MTEHLPEQRLVIHARPHPDFEVQRAGFPLDHRYVEQCWAPVIGPSSTLLLRRLPWLWRAGTTVNVEVGDLGRSLGLGAGTRRNSIIGRTLERIVAFRFAEWSAAGVLDVFTEARPLSARQLEQVPIWTRVLHEQLLDAHLSQLADRATQPMPSPPDLATAMAERLSHMQSRTPDRSTGLAR
jgi:hypothetical protein